MKTGDRVRIQYDARIHDDFAHAHEITGTIVEGMSVGFDLKVEWDDGIHRGKYDGWVSWTSIELVPTG